MKLRKSYSDVDRLYVDQSRNENKFYKCKLNDLDDLLGSINDKVSEMVFDSINIILSSADVEMPNILLASHKTNADFTKINISIEDQSGGGYLNYDFSFSKLITEQIESVEDDEEKENAIALARQLRKIADDIDSYMQNVSTK